MESLIIVYLVGYVIVGLPYALAMAHMRRSERGQSSYANMTIGQTILAALVYPIRYNLPTWRLNDEGLFSFTTERDEVRFVILNALIWPLLIAKTAVAIAMWFMILTLTAVVAIVSGGIIEVLVDFILWAKRKLAR